MSELTLPPSGRGRRTRKRDTKTATKSPNTRGVESGLYKPLSDIQLQRVDVAAREILTSIGMSEAPPLVIKTITENGGRLDDNGRLLFSENLIENALTGFQRNFVLHGRKPGFELDFSGHKVHAGTGGASPSILDIDKGLYRDATLADLYDAASLVEKLDHIHFFSRPLVARDMETDLSLDVNTAYACLCGTAKHIFTSATTAESVKAIADMCFRIAGSQEAFAKMPFLSLNINHVVSPLRYAEDACEVMAEAARLNIPFHANTFAQLGASTPVTIAGTLAQTTAETLAGMIFGWCINPNAKITFGARPMVTDLRTGAMSGGGGEQAKLMAAATQISKYYNLPDTCIAGATDSKIADAQSGYEKSLSITLVAQAGSNAITQAAGTHASLIGCALESYVIDNEMLGAIMRSVERIEFEDEMLAIETFRSVVTGEGHYLGQAETFNRMNSDFLYPKLADRNTFAQWQDEGAIDLREQAKAKTREMLSTERQNLLDDAVDNEVRAHHDIKLPRQ